MVAVGVVMSSTVSFVDLAARDRQIDRHVEVGAAAPRNGNAGPSPDGFRYKFLNGVIESGVPCFGVIDAYL